jgi:hypothetical protein
LAFVDRLLFGRALAVRFAMRFFLMGLLPMSLMRLGPVLGFVLGPVFRPMLRPMFR